MSTEMNIAIAFIFGVLIGYLGIYLQIRKSWKVLDKYMSQYKSMKK